MFAIASTSARADFSELDHAVSYVARFCVDYQYDLSGSASDAISSAFASLREAEESSTCALRSVDKAHYRRVAAASAVALNAFSAVAMSAAEREAPERIADEMARAVNLIHKECSLYMKE